MTLPNFIVIGVAKAGTTSLFHYLTQHPDIFVTPIKETNYFGYEDALDWQWMDEGKPPLLRHFRIRTFDDYTASFAGAKNETAVGEISNQYIRCPNAARRIHECLPDVKLVASLRNPADRAFSGLLMRTRRGEVVKSFAEELTGKSSHVQEGFYFQRLKRYYDLFPRDQIKIYLFEDFKKDPAGTMLDLFDFLGVDKEFAPDMSVQHNLGAVPRIRWLNRLFYDPTLIRITKATIPKRVQGLAKRVRQKNLRTAPGLPADLRTVLLDLYHRDILQLEQLLGRDLSIWLEQKTFKQK